MTSARLRVSPDTGRSPLIHQLTSGANVVSSAAKSSALIASIMRWTTSLLVVTSKLATESGPHAGGVPVVDLRGLGQDLAVGRDVLRIGDPAATRGDVPSVDGEVVPRHPGGLVGGQVERGAGDVVRLAEPRDQRRVLGDV